MACRMGLKLQAVREGRVGSMVEFSAPPCADSGDFCMFRSRVVLASLLWLGLLSPASGVIEGIASIGFIGFFVFMLSMGVAILRRRDTRRSVDIQRWWRAHSSWRPGATFGCRVGRVPSDHQHIARFNAPMTGRCQ